MCMKKFFTSGKFGIKNKKFASILDALLGWSFFVVSCCTALFLCFYASGSDDVAYADSAYCQVRIDGLLLDMNEKGRPFSKVLFNGNESTDNFYSTTGGESVTVQFTLKTGYALEEGEDGNFRIASSPMYGGGEWEWMTPSSSGDLTSGSYKDITDSSEISKLHHCKTIELKLNVTDSTVLHIYLRPDKYKVKFVSDNIKNFNDENGVIRKDVVDIECLGENVEIDENGEIYFNYIESSIFNCSISLSDNYYLINSDGLEVYLKDGNNKEKIDSSDNVNFSINFDSGRIERYNNEDIKIFISGIESKKILTIETDKELNGYESFQYMDFKECQIEGGDKVEGYSFEYGFYKLKFMEDCTIKLTMQSKPGYLFQNEKGKISVQYFPESERSNTDAWKNCDVDINKEYSPQTFTITIDVTDDTVIRVNDILFDKFKIRFMSDNKEYNNSNGFLQLYDESTNKERIEIIQDAKNSGLTQTNLENLSINFETPTHFKITPKGDYSKSDISVYVGEEKIPLCEEWYNTNHFRGYYEFKLDDNNIDKFYDKESGYVNITVKGICVNFVEILFAFNDDCLADSWNKVSSISCKGSSDVNEQQFSPARDFVFSTFKFSNVQIGGDRTAIIKIKLDQWYEFKKNDNYKKLISAINAYVIDENLEKREKNNNRLENYDTWYEINELEGVAVFKVTISEDISNGGSAVFLLNTVTDDMIEGYNNCSIEFTNKEEGLTFTKLDATSEGKFTLSDSSITNKNFSGIKFGEPNYFLVKADGFKCSLGENIKVNGRFAECKFVDDAVIEGDSTDTKNKKVICVTINDNSYDYYPGIPAEVEVGGVIIEDTFAMIEGINTEALKESDIIEAKKFETNATRIENSNTKITTTCNAPLSFIVRPASGYSFPDINDGNRKDILAVFEIRKGENGEGFDVSGENLIEDYTSNGKLTLKNFGNSLEISISGMSDNIYIRINSTPDKVPVNFKQSEGIEYFKVDEEKVGEVNEEKIGEQLRGTVTIDKNGDYKFAVKVLDGYDFQILKVFSNDVGISESGTLEQERIKIYTLSNIEKYTTVTASVEKLKCKLTFTKPPVGAYYTKVGSDKEITEQFTEDGILYGSNFSFCVKLKDEYNQSKLTVRAGNSEIQSLSDDTYTIYNITEDETISIDDNIKLNNYTVNFESSDRAEYILEGSNGKIKNVEYGSNCKFKVRAKTGYKLGENIAVNCVGASGSESLTGKKVSGSGNDTVYEYEIENITENKTVSVSGVEDLFYNIKLQDVEGVTYINDTGSVISGIHKIAYGKNFEFSVNVDDAYDDSISGMFIIVNEGKSMGVSAQKLSSGKYVIPNITQDITVRVGNIRKNRYTVTFTKTEGIDYYDTNGKIITGDTEVEQNDSISFKVSLYPAYSDSKITVMLGDKAVTADSSGVYTLTGIDENKTVTVLGVEKSKEAELINTINSLPNPVKTLDDVNLVVEASKIYNSLSDEKKKTITNYDLLQKLQEQVKAFHHISNDVKVEGVDWYLKLVAVPISSSTEICSRIYEKLNSEYILSLYDIYLWDTLTDKRYTLPSGTTAVISIPTPDMTYFNKPTGIHENDDGKIDYLSLAFDGGRTTFEAVTFSPFGVIANRSSTPGRSSLLDAVDANVDLIKDFALSSFGGNSSDKSGISESAIFDDKNSNSDLLIGSEDGVEGNISEKYKSRNNKVTARGSALRLILVLMIIVLIALALWILYRRRNEMKKSKNNKNS